MAQIILGLFWFFTTITPPAWSATTTTTPSDLESLKTRVEELERKQRETFEQMNKSEGFVHPFLGSGILLGGYFETALTYIEGPNTTPQYSASWQAVGVNLTANMTSDDHFIMQLQSGIIYPISNPQNDPSANPKTRHFGGLSIVTVLSQGFYEHTFSSLFKVQWGLGYAPFGQAFQFREPFLQIRRGGPQMLASTSLVSVGVAVGSFLGMHVSGSQSLGDQQVGYNLYTFTPSTDTGTIGIGNRIWCHLFDLVTLGVSHQSGKLANDLAFNTYGADIDFSYGRYGLTSEYAEDDTTNGRDAPRSFYVMPTFAIVNKKLLLYWVGDWMYNPTNLTGVNFDLYTLWTTGVGVNWLPIPTTRVRLGYFRNSYVGDNSIKNGQSRDYNSMDLSLVAAF